MYGLRRSRSALLRPVFAIAREAGLDARDSWPTPDDIAVSLHTRRGEGTACVVHARFLPDGSMEAVLRLPHEGWAGFPPLPGRHPPSGAGFGPVRHPSEPSARRLAESLRQACGLTPDSLGVPSGPSPR